MELAPLPEGLEPEEVIAACAPLLEPGRAARLDAVAAARISGLACVIEELLDPHNYGAVLRSSEAMGVGQVYTINGRNRFRVSPRVTQGCERWLDVHRFEALAPAVDALRRAGYRLLAAVPGAPLALDEIDPLQRNALCFGNEHLGLSPALRALCDGEFRIPMHGMSQSLNVSVSVAVSLSSLTTARRRALGRDGDLDEAERLRLRARFYAGEVRDVRAVVARLRADRGR